MGGEHSPTYQQKNGLKIYWAWPHPSEQDPVSSSVSLSHQEASKGLLSFSIRGQTDWKPHCFLTQWNHEPGHVGPPKMDGSLWRVLTKRGPLEKGMANHFSIFALRTPWTVWNVKNIVIKLFSKSTEGKGTVQIQFLFHKAMINSSKVKLKIQHLSNMIITTWLKPNQTEAEWYFPTIKY